LESELQGYNFEISKRTFQRDLEDIRSIYSIDIQCNTSNQYFIVEDDRAEANERIFEALDVFNAFNLTENLSESIQLEKRKPQGTENLLGLLHAVNNRLQITFSYQKFWENNPSQRTVEPYLTRSRGHAVRALQTNASAAKLAFNRKVA